MLKRFIKVLAVAGGLSSLVMGTSLTYGACSQGCKRVTGTIKFTWNPATSSFDMPITTKYAGETAFGLWAASPEGGTLQSFKMVEYCGNCKRATNLCGASITSGTTFIAESSTSGCRNCNDNFLARHWCKPPNPDPGQPWNPQPPYSDDATFPAGHNP